MPKFIAFLRAINVGGRTVTMAALRAHFEALPLASVETFIASGNVIFEAASPDPAALERQIESHLFNALGYAGPLDSAAARRVAAFKTEIDDFHVHGREVYWLCRKKQSDSTFSNRVFEKAIEMRATFRGMNTIRKLAAKSSPAAITATLPGSAKP